MATYDDQAKIKIWDLANNQDFKVLPLIKRNSPVRFISFSPDSKFLIIPGVNNSLDFFDIEKKQLMMSLKLLGEKDWIVLAYDKGMYILTAAQSYQAAFEVSRTQTGKEIKHGLLTFALLEALTNKSAVVDANGNVLDRSWFNYAVEEVPRMQIEEMKKRQGKGSELLFVNNDDKKLDAEKRRVQTPRIFYRREESQNPFIVARP